MKLENLDPEILKKYIQENRSKMFSAIVIVFIVIILVLLFTWIGGVLTLENRACNNLHYIYENSPNPSGSGSLSGIITRPELLKLPLAQFYIKTAYNCCSPGNYKNSFVNLCALRRCIKEGARCLDFEIYSVGKEPVIATSTLDSCKIKETYNSVSFNDAMQTVNQLAFSPKYTNVSEDPIFLHLRINTICPSNDLIYSKMANILNSNFKKRLMPSLYGKGYLHSTNSSTGNSQHLNFGKVPMINLMGRVIIMINTMPLALKICDPSNFAKSSLIPTFPSRCNFFDLVNVIGDSGSTISTSLHEMRYKDLGLLSSIEEEQTKNMTELAICLPDLASSADYNISFNMCKTLGIQFIGLCFQTFDTNLELADLFFKGMNAEGDKTYAGGSIQLKPAYLRPPQLVEVQVQEEEQHDQSQQMPAYVEGTINPSDGVFTRE